MIAPISKFEKESKMLKRDRRWEIFYQDISFEDFVNKKLPKPVFKKEVDKQITDSFSIAHKLLCHSYFEYLFVDIAVGKMLHIFEMAMLIRFKELNNGEEWDLKKKPLIQLIDWFNKRSYFEISSQAFLDVIRVMRNHLSHPKGHNFAGTVWLQWVPTILDLINGLYEDVDLRLTRWKLTDECKSKLNAFLANGAKFIAFKNTYYIYACGPIKIENRLENALCYFSLFPLFEVKDNEPKIPIVINYPVNNMVLEDSTLELSLGTKKIILSNELSSKEIEMISDFRAKIKENIDFQMQHSMLIFDADNLIRETIRKSLKYN